MKSLILLLSSIGIIGLTDVMSQDTMPHIEGVVYESNSENTPLIGANVFWLGTHEGTITDNNGTFSISPNSTTKLLVISYVGYQTDTVEVTKSYIEIPLNSDQTLETVEVAYESKSIAIDYLNPLKSEHIDEEELLKAACCNLSESFDTNPSVDVSFTDAVTGTRQIQMLGLAGPYTQITQENIPSVRGLSAIYGMSYVPGTWVESIQLNKGTGSVVNGFESMAGQINVELRKPDEGDKLYLNLYGNEGGRLETNIHLRNEINRNWSTITLLHGKNNQLSSDRNDDDFLDMPLGKHLIGLNRWKYVGDEWLRFQAGVKATYLDAIGGQEGYDPDRDRGTTNLWGMYNLTKRIEGWSKVGTVDKNKPWRSIGIQLSGVHDTQESFFGLRAYNATQDSFYGNLVYQTIINNTNHQIKTGLSYQLDSYDEAFETMNFDRIESVSGSFFEYQYTHSTQLGIVAGLRLDHHNSYGTFMTPRLHVRYEIYDGLVSRFTAGRGQRTASVLSENIGMLASSREIVIQGDGSNKPYGLDAEVSWNYGFSLVKEFILDYREGTLSVEYYHTNFENQIVLDLDNSARQAVFYNLDGESYSNSFQAQLDYELVRKLDVRLGYRWLDVQTTYGDALASKPFVSTHRLFLNAGYQTKSNWKFDYTVNWQGSKRIPNTSDNPVAYQLETESPSFFIMNTQVTKSWKSGLEVYLGVENLLNYTQSDPIIASEDPFREYFDSAMVWGPIFGRNTYMGLRYRL